MSTCTCNQSFAARLATVALAAIMGLALSAAAANTDGTWTLNDAGDWSDADTGNWQAGIVADGTGFSAYLSNVITANRIITLVGNRTIGNIYAQDTSNSYTISGVSTLTLDGSGSTKSILDVVVARSLTISAPVIVNDGLQANGAGSVTLSGGTTLDSTQIWDHSGDITISSTLGDGGNVYGLTKTGSGLLNIRSATLSYTGPTVVNGGVVMVYNNKPAGNFTLNGGMLTDYYRATTTFSGGLGAGNNQIQISGDSGFGGGNGNSNWRIGAQNSVLTWGVANEGGNVNATGYFNPTTLKFRAPLGDNNGSSIYGQATLQNRLDLNSGARTIDVLGVPTYDAYYASSWGKVDAGIQDTGAAGSLVKTGRGILILGGTTSTWGGNTTVSDGVLMFDGTNIANIGGGSGRNISVGAGTGVRFNAMSNAILNRIVETSDEIVIMTGTTANDLDFSSSAGANLPNAWLGNWAGNGAKTEYSGILTPASDNYRLGGRYSNGLLGIVGTNKLTGSQGLIVGVSGYTTASRIRVNLAGANSFTGDTVINTGAKLTIGNNLALQNSVLDVGAAGGQFALAAGTNGGRIAGETEASSPTFGGLKGSRNLVSVFTNSAGNNETNLAATAVTGFTLNPGTGVEVTYSGAIGGFGAGASGGLNGASALTKTGEGTQVLAGANTYTGATDVTQGTLLINGSTSAGSTVTVSGTGIIGGTGTIGGAVVVNSGGTLSPGTSVGTLAAGNTTWNDGGSLRFEIDDALGAAGTSGGPGWDLLNITGALDLSALTADGFNIDIDTLLPGGGTNPGEMDNFDPYSASGYDWEFVRTSGGISGFDAASFTFDASGLANPYDGTFEVAQQGSSLYITFRTNLALPDPGLSTVAASPASVPADGVSAATITVTLRDASGNPVPGMEVTLDFVVGSPGVADIAPATTQTTDANGVAVFTVSSATAGTEEFTAEAKKITGDTIIIGTVGVDFTSPQTIISQTSLIPGYTPPPPPPPDAPQTSLAVTPPPDSPPAPDAQTAQDTSGEITDPADDVAPGVIRVTEYYLTTGDFSGPATTVTLDQDLAADYFILVRGSRAGDGLSMPDSDYARVAAVPGGRGGLADSGVPGAIGLRRAAADVDWEGVVTVVECIAPDSPAGFRLIDAVVTVMSGASGSQICAPWVDAARVVPFGGYRGGGVELPGSPASRYQGTSAYVRLFPGGNDTLNWQRDGGGETLSDAIMTTFVVEWGAAWTVQHAGVVGGAGGAGADAAGDYTTAAIAPVTRANTWVWGTGIRADAGIGDCAESCLVTLGDGVNRNATESTVAVGSEYTDAYSFDVYALTHPALAVDHRFKPDGDLSGLDIPVAVAPALPGARFAWLYNGCDGTSSRFPRPRMWSRYTADDTVTISRGYAGAEFPAWIQGIDFSGLKHGHTD